MDMVEDDYAQSLLDHNKEVIYKIFNYFANFCCSDPYFLFKFSQLMKLDRGGMIRAHRNIWRYNEL